jgi:uncharacterized membrane protein (DUF485 family)
MKKIFILSSVFCTCTFASLHIDPYVGVSYLNSTFAAVEHGADNLPLTMGGRLGYSKLGLSLGGDYETTSSMKFKNRTQEYDATNIGFFMGYTFPILLRAYATYFVSANMKATGSEVKDGNGYKVGIGLTILPFIVVNVEYKDLTYDTLNGATSETTLKGYGVNISLPLNL